MASNDRPLRIPRTVILVKQEVTEGTDPIPSATTDAVQIVEGTLAPAGEVRDRKPLSASMSPKAPVQGTLMWDISLTVEAKTDGSANSGLAANQPEFHELLRASGLKQTLNPGVSIEYTPESDPDSQPTVTIYVYFDGVLHKLRACRFNCEHNVEAGNFGTFVFTGNGLYTKPDDAALPTTPNIVKTDPPVLESACVELGSPSAAAFNPILQNFTLNMNTTISPRIDPCSSYAIKGFLIGDRDPQGTYNPEATLLADHDFWDDYVQKTQQRLLVQLGKTAGQIVETDVPLSVIREMPYGERETFRTFEISYTAVGDDDDELIFRFR